MKRLPALLLALFALSVIAGVGGCSRTGSSRGNRFESANQLAADSIAAGNAAFAFDTFRVEKRLGVMAGDSQRWCNATVQQAVAAF